VATDAAWVSFAIALSDEQWELVADLFDPPGRRGAPAVIPRRPIVDDIADRVHYVDRDRTITYWKHGAEPVPRRPALAARRPSAARVCGAGGGPDKPARRS